MKGQSMKTQIHPRTKTSIHGAGVPEVELILWTSDNVWNDDYITLQLNFGGGAEVTVFIKAEDGQDITDLSAAVKQALMTPKVSHAER